MATGVILGVQARHRAFEDEEEGDEGQGLRRRSTVGPTRSSALSRGPENVGGGEDSPEDIPLYLRTAATLSLTKNLDHGQFSLSKIADVETLFDTLGRIRGETKISIWKMKELMHRTVHPAFTSEQVDIFFNGFVDESKEHPYKESLISPEELLSILKSEDEAILNLQTERRQRDQQVTREYFQEQVVRIVDRDDAFMTLPITVIYMAFFVYLVQGHLRIFERRQMENALEEFTNGRDPRETADENVDDIDSLWEWIENAGLRAPLGNVRDSTLETPDGEKYKHCILASRNVLIGDVKLTKTVASGEETSAWLLNSDVAKTFLRNESNQYEYLNAAKAKAADLKNNGWSGSDIEQMQLSFSSYNEFARMFAITTVTVPLPKLGNVFTRIDSSAVSIEPYPTIDLYVADSFFMCLALYIGFNEGKDAFAALRLGCGEFADYLQFWNLVDWLNIMLCILLGGCWLECIRWMINETLDSLLTPEYTINVNVMLLDEAKMDSITETLDALRVRYWFIQITMAVNVVSVVMKFFKSFQSNARLSVVSTTFKVASVDLAHFFIMFTTIFLPFVIIGHILFGSDIEEFASVTSSINTGISALMGDFTWYIDEQPSFFTELMPSGMPRLVVMIWYFAFMFLIFLVLLNMLLAVVLEYYTRVSSDVKFEVDAPAVWKQAWQYFKFQRETRGFMPLETMRSDLENDEDPAHPDPSVTVKSLLEAWSDMTEAQAAWLMDMLDRHSHLGVEKLAQRKKEQHVKHLAEENKEKLLEVSKGILDNSLRLEELEGLSGGQSEIGKSLEDLCNLVAELDLSVSKVRKEHDRLAVKVEDMMAAIPEGHRLELVEGAPVESSVTSTTGRRAREWKKASPASGRTANGAGSTKTKSDPTAARPLRKLDR